MPALNKLQMWMMLSFTFEFLLKNCHQYWTKRWNIRIWVTIKFVIQTRSTLRFVTIPKEPVLTEQHLITIHLCKPLKHKQNRTTRTMQKATSKAWGQTWHGTWEMRGPSQNSNAQQMSQVHALTTRIRATWGRTCTETGQTWKLKSKT